MGSLSWIKDKATQIIDSEFVKNLIMIVAIILGVLFSSFSVGIFSGWASGENPSLADPVFLAATGLFLIGISMILIIFALLMEE